MGARAQQNGAQMRVGESLKLAKSLIVGSGCDLNVHAAPEIGRSFEFCQMGKVLTFWVSC